MSARRARLLLVDNYDSFTFNLLQLFGALAEVDVVRNDDPTLNVDTLAHYDGTIVGPGPGRPQSAGMTCELVRAAARDARPLLGVCLGAQAIGEVFGGVVDHAPSLMHGKVSAITHDGSGLFATIPSPFPATRYHSLAVVNLPDALRASATSEDGVIQGLAHRELPIYGVQFHPESILTEHGATIAHNFIELTKR